MKKIFVFLLILLIFSTPSSARKIRAVQDAIDELQDLFKGEEVEMSGYVWYVDSDQAHSGNGKTWDGALVTLQEAIDFSVDDRGDTIYVAPGHAYSIISDGLIDLNKRGVTVKGMGNGDNRPTFTVSTALDADMHITADDCTLENLIFVNGKDNLEFMLTITANDVTISNCDFTDGTATSGLSALAICVNDGDDIERITVQDCVFYQVMGNADHAIELLWNTTSVKIIDNYFFGDYAEGVVRISTGGNAAYDLLIDKNTMVNIQASGKGISFEGTPSNPIILGDNVISVDTVGNAYDLIATNMLVSRTASIAGGLADGDSVYPASVVNDSLWAKVLGVGSPASASTFSNLTHSLEAIGDDTDSILEELAESDANIATILEELAEADANAITILEELAEADANHDTIMGYIDTEITTLVEEMAEVDANLLTIDDFLDTEIQSLLDEAAEVDANFVTALEELAEVDANLITIAGYIDTEITTILEELAEADTNLADIKGYVDTEVTTLLEEMAEADTNLADIKGYVDTEITTLLEEVAEIDANMITALEELAEVDANLVTIDGYLDTEIASIMVEQAEVDANLVTVLEELAEVDANLLTIDDLLDTEIASIMAEQAEADTNLADIEGYVDTEITSTLVELAESDANMVTVLEELAEVDANLVTIDDFLDTEIASLLAEAAEADANLLTIEGYIDTEITTLLEEMAEVDANLIIALEEIAENDANMVTALEEIAEADVNLATLVNAAEQTSVIVLNPIPTGLTNLFEVSGAVQVTNIAGWVTSVIQNQECLVNYSFDPCVPAGDTAIADSGAALDIDSAAEGSVLTWDGVLANNLTLTAGGVAVGVPITTTLVLPKGMFELDSTAANSGEITFYIRYIPLASGATITAYP